MATPANIKRDTHAAFFRGEGPSLILVPTGEMQLYDTGNYRELFYSPKKMWEAEIQRARPVLDWPTDGIPTVRPNLGTIFVPGMTGQGYHVQDGQMPWHDEPLTVEAIREARQIDAAQTELIRLAAEFYEIHADANVDDIVAYQPDTQGVFDIAHLLYGDNIFYEIVDESRASWIEELLDICLDLMLRATHHVKSLLHEPDNTMVHGHGTPQGIFFPHAGIRISEDTATLISPKTIERFILPVIEKGATPFRGAFIHYCGRHPFLFEQLCNRDYVRAIDLGNPEMYDIRWLMERCAETGTVLYSRIAEEPGETWQAYIRRLGALVKQTGARCILRPLIVPDTRAEAAAMCDMWHELTE